MRALVLEAPGQLEHGDRPRVGVLPPGHARARVRRVGICGTDWHAFAGRQPFFTYPRVLGHELGVEVTEVASDVSSLSVGDRCAVEPYLHCGDCIACRRGRTNCCERLQVLGVHIDGGMAGEIVVPAAKLHPSASLPFEALALVETLAIGRHAVTRAAPEAGEAALVLGAGPIGLSTLPFLREAGCRVFVADVSTDRLRTAKAVAEVDGVLDATGDLPATLRERLDGELPTIVIDATGNRESMRRSVELLAATGRLVYVGLVLGDVAFDDPSFHKRETTLLASRNALPGDFKAIIKLIEAGRVDTGPWITHRCTSGELPDALSTWRDGERPVLKAIIDFDGGAA